MKNVTMTLYEPLHICNIVSRNEAPSLDTFLGATMMGIEGIAVCASRITAAIRIDVPEDGRLKVFQGRYRRRGGL